MIFCSLRSSSQDNTYSIREEVDFCKYLVENELYDDLLLNVSHIDHSKIANSLKDTLVFFTGMSYNHFKEYDSSNTYFNKLEFGSPFYSKSRAYVLKSLLFQEKYKEAEDVVSHIQLTYDFDKSLLNYEKAGVCLLNRDYIGYNACGINDFDKSFIELQKMQRKSPFVAGLLSGIIPGMGKAYAGKPKHGLSSFLVVTTLAVQTVEAYSKGGSKSAGFYAFGSLLTIFYIGNIWGSVMSVKIIRDEKNYEIDNKILLDLCIPLNELID